MCIDVMIQSGDFPGNKLKINRDGYIFTVPTADSREKILLRNFKNAAGVDDMAVNAALGGGAANIWDGTGAGDTGTPDFTFVSGGVSVENAASMHAGTNGLDNTLAAGDKLTFSGTTDMTASTHLSFWIQPIAGYIAGPQLRVELRLAGNRIGNRLDATLYMADELVGTWKLVSIPLADFGAPVTTVDEVRVQARNVQKNFYFDELQHGTLAGGATVDPIYLLKPSNQQEFRVGQLNMHITSTTAATTWRQSWEPTNFANLAALASGVIFEISKFNRVSGKVEVVSHIFTKVADIIAASVKHDEMIGVSFSSINMIIPANNLILSGNKGDFMRMVVRDNLSALSTFTCHANGVEKVLPHKD